MKDKYNITDNFIILDTNIYVKDFLLKGMSFKILLEGLEKINGISILPEIVSDEIIVKYSEFIETKFNKLNTSLKNLKKLSINDLKISIPEDVVSKAVKTYRKFIQNMIDSNRFSLADIPKVNHKEIIKRCLQRKKPFKLNGAGYRDYLIWKTVLLTLQKHSNKNIFFISDNTTDFFEQNKLHSDLINDLSNNKLKEDSLNVYTNLNDFNSERIIPVLDELDNIKDELNKGEYKYFDIESWVNDSLEDLIESEDKWEEMKEIGFGFPKDCGTLSKYSIEHISDITVNDVNKLPSDELLISFSINVNIAMEIDISSYDWKYDHKIFESLGYSFDPYSPMPNDFENNFEIEISLFVLGNTEQVTGSEINYIDADIYDHNRYY